MNRKLILNLIVPLTVLLFILFTKWWIADVVDGTDGIMYGFPLIYKAPAFYTSMAEEFFITEFIIDFLIYFVFTYTTVYIVNRFLIEITIKKVVARILQIMALLLVCLELLFVSMPENRFILKRDFEIELKETGFKFYFNADERKNFDTYHQ